MALLSNELFYFRNSFKYFDNQYSIKGKLLKKHRSYLWGSLKSMNLNSKKIDELFQLLSNYAESHSIEKNLEKEESLVKAIKAIGTAEHAITDLLEIHSFDKNKLDHITRFQHFINTERMLFEKVYESLFKKSSSKSSSKKGTFPKGRRANRRRDASIARISVFFTNNLKNVEHKKGLTAPALTELSLNCIGFNNLSDVGQISIKIVRDGLKRHSARLSI